MSKASGFAIVLAVSLSLFAVSCSGPAANPPQAAAMSGTPTASAAGAAAAPGAAAAQSAAAGHPAMPIAAAGPTVAGAPTTAPAMLASGSMAGGAAGSSPTTAPVAVASPWDGSGMYLISVGLMGVILLISTAVFRTKPA